MQFTSYVEFYEAWSGGTVLWAARVVHIPRIGESVVSPASVGVPIKVYEVNDVCWDFHASSSVPTVKVLVKLKEEEPA